MTEERHWPASSSSDQLSRRDVIRLGALGLGGLAITRTSGVGTSSAFATTGSARQAITAVKAIHHEVDFKTAPARIYEALMDSKQFTTFAGGRAAEIHRDVGGTFSLFAGHIVGRNLELVPMRRIVQAWRVVDWPEGIYSIARFELQAHGSGTHLVFDHTGFPSDLAEHLESGWQENYWKALQSYLG